jgi:hypothetical protein
MASKTYRVLIPKYEFTIENGKAVKKLCDSSLSIEVVCDNPNDAYISALVDLDHKALKDAGYHIHNVEVSEVIGGEYVKVFIRGINK